MLEAQEQFYVEKLGFATEDGEAAWTALPPFASHDVDLYEAAKRLSDYDLDGLHTLLTAPSFGQILCDRLDTGDSLFNRVAQDVG